MWDAPVPIFDDEDEQEFINEFVKLSARYPNHEPIQITAYIFKNRRDPFPRANQAALVWSQDLEVQEKIRQAKLTGGVEETPVDDKNTKLRKLEAIYNDEDVKPADRIKALELHAKISGEIDGDEDGDKPRGFPVFNFAIDPRSQNAA